MSGTHRTIKLPELLTDDAATVLAKPLREAARAPEVTRLTLDATEMIDVSARGLGLLVAVSRLARSRGAQVLIVDASPNLHGLFDAAKLDYRQSLAGHSFGSAE